jgi:hypothetical protein
MQTALGKQLESRIQQEFRSPGSFGAKGVERRMLRNYNRQHIVCIVGLSISHIFR